MIRINLLPVRETRRAAVLRQQGLMLTSALALAVVVCIGMQLWVSSGVSGERERVAQSQAERARLAETLNRIDVFQAEEKEISRKLEVIETLERLRVGPVRLMDEIAARIPERLWLIRMKLTQSVLRIDGISLDNEAIAAFMTSLEESEYLGAVELKSTRLKLEDDVKINAFTLEAQLQTKSAGQAPSDAGADSPA
ncbi:MAG: PilN domain-containing protein [Myxococcales bacterium]|nr:PilN domain-containing protein [Myxococcales bacterium]